MERWEQEYRSVVDKGRALWISAELGTNGVACAQYPPNTADTHPKTYPSFQQQLGKVIALREMTNSCLLNPPDGKPLELDDPDLVAIEAYVTFERRGAPLAPGKY